MKRKNNEIDNKYNFFIDEIRFEEDKFIFNFKKDGETGIIYLERNFDKVCYYGYEFNKDIDGDVKSEFLKQIRYRNLSSIKNDDYEFFIKKSVNLLNRRDCGKYNSKDIMIINKNIENMIIGIKSNSYFSIAKTVKKPKYREYLKNFLKFKNSNDEKIIKAIQSDFNILIVDDINTSGSTIKELNRNINLINPSTEKNIFTLLGKS